VGIRAQNLIGNIFENALATTMLFSVVVAASLLLCATRVEAQVSGYGRSSAPLYGGIGMATRPANPYPPMQGTFADYHRTPDGKPCISVNPSVHPQIINPKIIDQIVIVNNICGQSIRVQVCFADSSDCIIVPLEGYQRLQRVLGISTTTVFKYEYRELF